MLEPAPGDYRPQATDTAEWADRLQFERWRSMTPTEKAELLSSLCRALHELALAGLRARRPELDEAALEEEAARIRLGDELYCRARHVRR